MKASLFALLILTGGVTAADGQPRVLTCGGLRWSNGVRLGVPSGTVDPFPELYRPAISSADADFTGDGVPEMILGAGGVDHAPLVGVFDGMTEQRLASWTTGEPAYTRVSVAAGDVDGDGFADIFVGSHGAWVHGNADIPAVVRIYSGRNGVLLYTRTLDVNRYRYGLEIAAGDVNGDGLADLVLAPGPGLRFPSRWSSRSTSRRRHAASAHAVPGMEQRHPPRYGRRQRGRLRRRRHGPDGARGPARPRLRRTNGRWAGVLLRVHPVGTPGGVLVTAGDFSGDGRAEVVTFGPVSVLCRRAGRDALRSCRGYEHALVRHLRRVQHGDRPEPARR